MLTEESVETHIADGVAILRRGGVVAYPTDTLYGLGADAFQEAALERLFEIKERPMGMPLPLLLADLDMLPQVSEVAPPLLELLAERFWPGPLTLVVPASERMPSLVTARGWTVAVRVPDNLIPRELARRLGSPITGTSANRSGGPEPRTANEVRHQLGTRVDLIIPGKHPLLSQASTILDLTGPTPRLLREGAIPWATILEVCPELENAAAT